MPPEEDKMGQLRRLDASVTKKATSVSIVMGVIGTLILGTGMSLTMTNLNEIFDFSHEIAMVLGIIIGIGSVIAIMTVGNSLTMSVSTSMQSMGVNNINVIIGRRDTESDADWDAAKAELDAAGYQDFLDNLNAAYDRLYN